MNWLLNQMNSVNNSRISLSFFFKCANTEFVENSMPAFETLLDDLEGKLNEASLLAKEINEYTAEIGECYSKSN